MYVCMYQSMALNVCTRTCVFANTYHAVTTYLTLPTISRTFHYSSLHYPSPYVPLFLSIPLLLSHFPTSLPSSLPLLPSSLSSLHLSPLSIPSSLLASLPPYPSPSLLSPPLLPSQAAWCLTVQTAKSSTSTDHRGSPLASALLEGEGHLRETVLSTSSPLLQRA